MLKKLVKKLAMDSLVRGVLTSSSIRILGILITYVQGIFMARLLVTADFGIFVVAQSLTSLIGTVVTLGFGLLAMREIPRAKVDGEPRQAREFVLSASVFVFGASAIVVAVLTILALNSEDVDKSDLFFAVAAMAPAFGILLLCRGVLQGFRQVAIAQLPIEVLRPLLCIVTAAAAVLLGFSLASRQALAIAAATSVVCALIAIYHVLKATPSVKHYGVKGALLSQALPFLVVAAVTMAGSEASILLLGWLRGPEDAALFQPVAKLAALMIVAREALNAPLAPRLAEALHANNMPETHDLARRGAWLLFAATGAIATGLVVAGPLLLTAFGPEFTRHAGLLVWFAGAQIVASALGPSSLVLAMAGKMRARILAQSLAVATQIALCAAWIGPFGVEGAAAAIVVGLGVSSVVNWYAAWKLVGVDASVFSRRAA